MTENKFTLPEWMLKDHPDDAERLSNHIRSFFFQEIKTELEKHYDGKLDQELISRMQGRAYFHALERTKKLADKANGAFLYQVDDAHQNGWHANCEGEYDTVEELLTAIADSAEEGTSFFYDASYIARTVAPILRSMNVDTGLIFSMAASTSKTREAVPAFRALFTCPECGESMGADGCPKGHKAPPPQEVQEAATKLVKSIANPNVSVRQFREEKNQVMGKASNLVGVHEPELYEMGGETWVVIRTKDPAFVRTMQLAMKNFLTDAVYRDPFALARELSGMK